MWVLEQWPMSGAPGPVEYPENPVKTEKVILIFTEVAFLHY